MKPETRHIEQSTLALLSGGDLAWPEALAARWHVHFCPQCKRQLAEFRSARMEIDLLSEADWRQPLDGQPGESDPAWNALEAEMRANIRLGLTAGSLASGPAEAGETAVPPLPFAPWRWAVVGGALVFVLTAGWWLRSSGGAPLPTASVPAWEMPATEQAGQGTGQAAGIQLLVPVADVSRTETDFDGSTRSRVIDGETGQVTLQQVYAE
jgi:hypothetical protein